MYQAKRTKDDIEKEIELLERMVGYKKQEILNIGEYLDTADTADEKAHINGIIAGLDVELVEYETRINELKEQAADMF